MAVHRLRGKAKVSQGDLAERAGLAPIRIAEIESGAYDPSWGDVRRIATALGVSLEALSELAEQHELDREV